MTSRINVNVNNFSTPFSTQVNTIAARNEERRLERIYGGDVQPQKTQLEEAQERARSWDRRKAVEVSEQQALSTFKSTALVCFDNRQYALPPVRSQDHILIYDHGDFDAHFGGLGISRRMITWFQDVNVALARHNLAAFVYNTHAVEKSKGGFLKKKAPLPVLVPKLDDSVPLELFNRKLAQARVAARLDRTDNDELRIFHPSSESGNFFGEMKTWADKYWQGVEEKPWNESMLKLPKITKSVQFTQNDADRVNYAFRTFLTA